MLHAVSSCEGELHLAVADSFFTLSWLTDYTIHMQHWASVADLLKALLALQVTCPHEQLHLEQAFSSSMCGLQGNDSFCCEDCLDGVIAGGVRITFHGWVSVSI